MNFAHRLFYIYTRGLVLQQLKTPYITGITAIELNSHWYVILPFCRLKANETSRNNFCQVMADNRVTVVVSNKFLQIDDISSEFEFLNNYLLLYILIRFIISVCFLSLDYCIDTRLFSLIGRISQSLILLSFEIFFHASSFKIYYLFYEVRFFLVVLELLCFVTVPQFVFSSLFL